MTSSVAGSEYRPPSSRIARSAASETSKEGYTFMVHSDEASCHQLWIKTSDSITYTEPFDNVPECLGTMSTEPDTKSDPVLTIRATPSVARTFSHVVIVTTTTPTCATTLYTEPLITFGPTSTAWADTITSVRSLDCSGCDLAILYGGHVYRVRTG